MHKSVLIALLAGIFALGLVNVSIYKKESLLKNGETVLLELAPVDPRSLMQGDYMALRFKIGNDIQSHVPRRVQEHHDEILPDSRDGFVIVTLDENLVGKFAGVDDGNERELAADERRIQFRIRNGVVKFATNAFFFQEGTGRLYEQARYGEFRLGAAGDILLTGLRGETLEKLGPAESPSVNGPR